MQHAVWNTEHSTAQHRYPEEVKLHLQRHETEYVELFIIGMLVLECTNVCIVFLNVMNFIFTTPYVIWNWITLLQAIAIFEIYFISYFIFTLTTYYMRKKLKFFDYICVVLLFVYNKKKKKDIRTYKVTGTAMYGRCIVTQDIGIWTAFSFFFKLSNWKFYEH